MERINNFCKDFGINIEVAENKLKECVGDCEYFKTKHNKGTQLEALYFATISLKNGYIQKILEIGTGYGTMADILTKLFPMAQIDTVDLPENDKNYLPLAIRKENPERFQEIISQPNIHYHNKNSFYLQGYNELSDKDEIIRYDLIWLDGGHNYPVVAWDLAYSYNHLGIGGYLFIHDYNRPNTDVKRAVDHIANIIPEKINYLPFALYDPKAATCWLKKI